MRITDEHGYENGFAVLPSALVESGLNGLGLDCLGLLMFLNNEWRCGRAISQQRTVALLGEGRAKIRSAWAKLEAAGFLRKCVSGGVVRWRLTVALNHFKEQQSRHPRGQGSHSDKTLYENRTDPCAKIEHPYISIRTIEDKTVPPYPPCAPRPQGEQTKYSNCACVTPTLSQHYTSAPDCRSEGRDKTVGGNKKYHDEVTRAEPVLTSRDYASFAKLLGQDLRKDSRSEKACKRQFAALLGEGYRSDEIVGSYEAYSRDITQRSESRTLYAKSLYAWLSAGEQDRFGARAYAKQLRLSMAKEAARMLASAARAAAEAKAQEKTELREYVISTSAELTHLENELRTARRAVIHASGTPAWESLHEKYAVLTGVFEQKLNNALADTERGTVPCTM